MTARILVVDDIPANVRLLEAKLVAEYFDVRTADSGRAALDLLAREPADIVLLDVTMPEMDGFEVCRHIKRDAKTTHIPVIMVTALNDASDRVRGLEAGADDFLTKPVDDVALFARVRSLIRLKMSMDELRLRENTGEQMGAFSSPDDGARDDVAGGRVLLVADDDFVARGIADFAREVGCDLRIATDAAVVPDLAAIETFDLIMASLDLPGDDALRLTSRLRSRVETRSVPILLIMEAGDLARMAKGLEIGANDYLVQPIDRHEMIARMRTQFRHKRYQDRLRASYRESLSLAVTDPLTGLYNRRYYDVHLKGQLERAAATDKPLAILMIDIDHFKLINDSHGHAVGDEVLAELACRIVRSVRNFDTVSRLGGEEFAVVMPDANAEQAIGVAERLRAAVAETPMTVSTPEGRITVTASVGVALSLDGGEPAEELCERADRAMYEAKRQGRNRVIVAPTDGRPEAA